MYINIWVTKKCNMKCSYCYEGIEKESRSMDYVMCDKVIDYINEVNETVNIRFHGGEPLIAYSIIKYFYNHLKTNSKVKTFGLTTNGLLLDDEKINFLCTTMDDLSLSIDGKKDVNDLNRRKINGEGTYDIIVPACRKVLAINPLVRARMTVTPDTISKLYESVIDLLETGFKVIAIAVDLFNSNWTDENQMNYFEAAKKLMLNYGNNPEYHISIIDKSTMRKLSPCGGGKTGIHIEPDGDFYPCNFTVGIPTFRIGNINTGVIKGKVDEIKSISKIINPDCKGCKMYDFCTGTQCKLINKLVTNEYSSPPFATCMDQNVRTKLFTLN